MVQSNISVYVHASMCIGHLNLRFVLVIKEIPCSPVTQRNSKTDLSLRSAAGSLDANFATPSCTRSAKHSPRKYLEVSLFRAFSGRRIVARVRSVACPKINCFQHNDLVRNVSEIPKHVFSLLRFVTNLTLIVNRYHGFRT